MPFQMKNSWLQAFREAPTTCNKHHLWRKNSAENLITERHWKLKLKAKPNKSIGWIQPRSKVAIDYQCIIFSILFLFLHSMLLFKILDNCVIVRWPILLQKKTTHTSVCPKTTKKNCSISRHWPITNLKYTSNLCAFVNSYIVDLACILFRNDLVTFSLFIKC